VPHRDKYPFDFGHLHAIMTTVSTPWPVKSCQPIGLPSLQPHSPKVKPAAPGFEIRPEPRPGGSSEVRPGEIGVISWRRSQAVTRNCH